MIIMEEASCASELFQLLKTPLLPDVFLLDYDLPDLNGIETARKIRCNPCHQHVKLIMLASQSSTNLYSHGHNLICQAIDAGLDGFILKNSSMDDVVLCILKSFEGQTFMLGETIKIFELTDEIIKDRKRLYNLFKKDCQFGLSARDIEILQYIVQGYSAKEIAALLEISEEAVTNHKDHMKLILQEKYGLHFKNIVELAVWAIKNQVVSL